jgi:hypothetical protein
VTHEPDQEIHSKTIWDGIPTIRVHCRYCGAILRDRVERPEGFQQWIRPQNDQCWGRAATAAAEEHGLD